MMIVDGHRHIGIAGWRGCCGADDTLRDMDRFSVSFALVLPIQIPEEQVGDEDQRQQRVDHANRQFIEHADVDEIVLGVSRRRSVDHALIFRAVSEHSDRFGGVYQVNPWLGDDELRKAEQAIAERSFLGIKLNPMYNSFPADHAVVDAVLELAARRRVPVMVHTSYGYGSEPRRVANLAARRPDVQVIMYHPGVIGLDNRIQANEAAELARRYDNLWIDLADSQPPSLAAFVGRAPADRMIFGSDSPFGNLERQLGRVREAFSADPKRLEAVLSLNIARLFERCGRNIPVAAPPVLS